MIDRVVSTIIRKFETIMMTTVPNQYGDQIQITGDVVEAAAGTPENGKEVMILLDRCKDQIRVTEQVVSSIVREFDKTVVTILLDRCGDQI